MLKVNNLNKFYNKNKSNEIHVINDVTLELPNQGLVAFLGASGSGKTTLLNVIGGLDKGMGSISYDGFEMKKYEMSKIDKYRNEHFGYVFQTYNLLLDETVYDNLRIALELIDIYDVQEASSRIEYALKSVGMYKYRKKKASQLSGGQQQRVAIARALVKHCKVIIADEPTGNLDSANAVEVMNILKSISKKTLVLLVTHNEALADFYSDYVYKIADGKIVSQRENVSTDTLQTSNDNIIYLKDLNLVENDANGISVKLYGNEGSAIDLEIVERNNTFYIRSNKTLKLVENSNVKLVNEHYKPVEKSAVAEHDYDDSFFNNSVKKRNVFQDFITNIKRSFLSFIKPTKKVKMLYSSLAFIGILFSICAIAISNAIKVDTQSINADSHYSTLSNSSYYYLGEDGALVKDSLQNGSISSVQAVTTRYATFAYQINYVEQKTYEGVLSEIYYNDKVNKIVHGRAPKGDEIAISVAMADKLLEEFDSSCNSYEDLFRLTVDNGRATLVGIVEGDYKMSYVSKARYLESIRGYLHVPDTHQRYQAYEKAYNSYEIIAGRDLIEDDEGTSNILVSDKFVEYESAVGEDIPGVGFVVGVYRMKDIESDREDIMVRATYSEPLEGSSKYENAHKYSYEMEDYVLAEGTQPQKENECLVSIYSSLKIGETFDGYKIVGKYNGSTQLLGAHALLSVSALSIDDYHAKVFMVENQDALIESVRSSDYVLKTMYDNEYDNLENENQEKMTVFGILGGICLISASVMVFFLMRSKMINDIYNIGVYRSLGSNKGKIYLKYLCDTLVMITFTSLIAYGALMFVYFTAIDSINDYFMWELFSRSLVIPLLGVAVLYLVNIVFGLLPIITLLRKTPSEIMAKYDI